MNSKTAKPAGTKARSPANVTQPKATNQDALPAEWLNIARRLRQTVTHNGLYSFQLIKFDNDYFISLEFEPGPVEKLG